MGCATTTRDHPANLRDVGGLRTRDGRVTRSAVLLRSDAPHPGDVVGELPGWPPALVVDLRSAGEITEAHPLAGPATRVVSLSLAADASVERVAERHSDLSSLYTEIITQRGAVLAEAVGHVAGADGPALVHCAAGKDRTGLVVAAALAAVDVRRDDIVADYHHTEANMPAVIARFARDPAAHDAMAELIARRPQLATAPPVAIASVLDHFDAAGGAARWLRAHGLEPVAIERLAARLLAQ
jgi:hypothetical protein